MVVKEGKRQSKTEVLSMRMDPRTRFWVEIVSRIRGQSISTVVERALLEAADNAHTPEGHTWRHYWDVQEGIRSLEVAKDDALATYEDEYRLEFTKIHWPFFYGSSEYESYHGRSIEVLWPKMDEFLSLWSKTKSSDYFAAGKAMQQALKDAGVPPPDWGAKEPVTNRSSSGLFGDIESNGGPQSGGPSLAKLPPGFLDELRDRTPLAALVGRGVQLTRSGRQWKGCCPFHEEKKPSFYVYEDGHYHCFGCGAHGDAVGFVMRSEGVGFVDAVERLAAEAGLTVPEPSAEAAAAKRKQTEIPLEEAQKRPTDASGTSREGGPSWDAPKVGDLDDEIPF